MTEAGSPSLGARLALAFVVVAVAAVSALALVMLLVTRSETGRVSEQERARTAEQVAAAATDAYEAAGSWPSADLTVALARAQESGAVAVVRDAGGAVVAGAGRGGGGPGGPRRAAAAITRPVVAGGEQVGTVELRFRATLTAAEQLLRDRLVRAVLLGSALAVAIALAGAALVTRRVVRPLRRLATAAGRLEAGDLEARAADASAPGELGELSRAFDRMAEELDRQQRSRRRLVSDLAHEIRTPVTIVQGNLEELIDGGEPATTERLASLHEEVLRLGLLIEQLEGLARAEAPVAALDRETVDLQALVAAQLDALAPQFAAKRLAVDRRLGPATVSADRARLGQVVANLLGNALKFTPERGRIEVAVAEVDGEARIEVADTGPGIAPEERERVFERFWRGTAAAGVSGQGIGLAVAREIVHAHGGRLEAGGDGGAGARFVVSLPAG